MSSIPCKGADMRPVLISCFQQVGQERSYETKHCTGNLNVSLDLFSEGMRRTEPRGARGLLRVILRTMKRAWRCR